LQQLSPLFKGTYNGRPFPVSTVASLQKSPPFCSETVSPSSREATMKACAPRPNRQGQLAVRPRPLESTACSDPTRALVVSFAPSSSPQRHEDAATPLLRISPHPQRLFPQPRRSCRPPRLGSLPLRAVIDAETPRIGIAVSSSVFSTPSHQPRAL